ncbi:hypothetical protein WA026_014872 [Henosepilachna vigintioctopunctata]|uniref:ADP/ATP translocase n=1 Tax=Henosepilachna vigintioctopunctata TaxID=420089 RepID=A0AAW1V027_9CUCU
MATAPTKRTLQCERVKLLLKKSHVNAQLSIHVHEEFSLRRYRISATVAVSSIAPFEGVKLILRVRASSKHNGAAKEYKGITDAFVRIPQEQGFLSLWRDDLAIILRYFSTQALNFRFKDAYKQISMDGVDRKTNFFRYFSSYLAPGGAAGPTSVCFVYSLD